MLRVLARLGVENNGTGKGSHVGVTAASGHRSLVQDSDLPPTYIATILKQLHISEDDFLRAYQH